MNITKIELINFRKFNKICIQNLKLLNVIIGKNGIGKTTLIESIYFGSIGKSFKSYYDNILIKEEEKFLKVKIYIEEQKKEKKLELILNGKEKIAKIDNKVIKKLSNYICQYSVILFSPDDIRLIKDSPSIRRNYINIQISNINKNYLNLINNYNKLIKNKNDYLKKINLNSNLDVTFLDVIDKKIIELGLLIYNYRKEYIQDTNLYIGKIFNTFKKEEKISIKYISDFENKTEIELLNLFKRIRKKEMMLGISSIGIHRDDLKFIHNNLDAVNYSSQGIQKLILISLKIAEMKVLNNKYGIKPILLLDDLFSELDESNQRKVMKLVNEKFQTFITTTDINNLKLKDKEKINIIKIKEESKYEKSL